MHSPKCEDFAERVDAIFDRAPFVRHLGIKLVSLSPGVCETTLVLRGEHLQQNDVVHAGVVATLADHTAGAAAGSLVGENDIVLTAEYKISLLRPAVGESLTCKAEVLRAGSTLVVAESSVFAAHGHDTRLVAKALVTLAVVTRKPSSTV